MYKKQKSIKDYLANESFEDVFAVRFKKEIKQTKNGKYFFELKIQDSFGDSMLKYWGQEDLTKIEEIYAPIEEDTIIYAKGRVNEYNGKLDFSVNEGSLKILQEDEYDLSDFIRKTEKNTDEMFVELKKHIESIQNQELKKILNEFFENPEFVKKFKTSPAAMYIHHGWVSGLLEHTLTVLNICLDLEKYYENIDRDLLITGAILHDIGKIQEFKTTTQIKITTKGNLLSHMIIGVQEVTKIMEKLNTSEKIRNKLIHIIITHHEKIEYGCPKTPMTPEALLIAKVDSLDAGIVAMLDLKKNSQTNDSFAYDKNIGQVYLDKD